MAKNSEILNCGCWKLNFNLNFLLDQTDFILDDDEQNNSYVSELIDVIRELNLQVQTKDEQLESIQEELRSRSIWNKGDLHVSSKCIFFVKLFAVLLFQIMHYYLRYNQLASHSNF